MTFPALFWQVTTSPRLKFPLVEVTPIGKRLLLLCVIAFIAPSSIVTDPLTLRWLLSHCFLAVMTGFVAFSRVPIDSPALILNKTLDSLPLAITV